MISFTFEQLLNLANKDISNPMFVIDIISVTIDIRGKIVDGDEKILQTLFSIAKRGITNKNKISLFDAASKNMLEFVLPSIADAKKNKQEDVWSVRTPM